MSAIDLHKKVEAIRAREDLAEFIECLREDLIKNPSDWENVELSSFLEAMAAWVRDMDGFYHNLNKPVPEKPTWRIFGFILLAAKTYE